MKLSSFLALCCSLLSLIILFILLFLWSEYDIYYVELIFVVLFFGIVSIYKYNTNHFLLHGFQIVSLLIFVFSVSMIEKGAYIIEQFRYGYINGSTLLSSIYVLIAIMFSSVFKVYNNYTKGYNQRYVLKGYFFLNYILFGVAAVYTFLILKSNILIDGLSNRFIFWEKLSSNVLVMIAKYVRAVIPCTASLLGFLSLFSGFDRLKKISILLFLYISLCLFLTGDKASPFVLSLFYFVIGVVFSHIVQNKKIIIGFKTFLRSIIIMIVIITTSLLGFVYQHHVDSKELYTLFSSRMALQGHVLFGAVDVLLSNNQNSFIGVLDLLRKDSLDTPSGLNYISYFVSDYDFVRDRISRGITFTMGGMAVVVAMCGMYAGIIVFVLLFMLYSFVFQYAYWKILKGQWLFFIITMLFLVSLNSVFLMGNWYSLYNSASLLFYSVVIFDFLTKKYR